VVWGAAYLVEAAVRVVIRGDRIAAAYAAAAEADAGGSHQG
jgi:hypothetical protein